MILFNTNENIIVHYLHSIVGTCLLIDHREMMDPREMTGWKTDVQGLILIIQVTGGLSQLFVYR